MAGLVPHDGVYRDGSFQAEVEATRAYPGHGLLRSGGGLAGRRARPRRGRSADRLAARQPRGLSLIGRGLVHVAGVHLTTAGQPGGNAAIVRRELGAGYSLLRVARWEEGIAFAPGRGSPPSARRCVPICVGRPGGRVRGTAVPRRALGRPPAAPALASDHRGVAEAVRSGWADAGVCLRLVSEEAGLDFLRVREEIYDLCFPDRWEGDHRIQALLQVVRSPSYRRALGELPGYDSTETGELYQVS